MASITTTYTMQTQPNTTSSTWAASVPMNLAEAITAAVGPQPVPQLPAKQVALSAAQQQDPAAHQLQTQLLEQAPAEEQPDVPTSELYLVRRPTAAEARAASPPVADGLQQELLLQDNWPAQAVFDDMDNLQLQDDTIQAADAFGSDAVAVASVHAGAHKVTDLQATQLSQHQQHQLLSQLWSELQAPQPPAAHASERCSKLHLQAKPVVHLHATNSGHLSTSTSLQSSSSCCSSAQEAAGRLALAAAAAAAAASAAAVASAGPDSPCGSVHSSRALSSCSTSSSKKRVSWGAPVVYQLPPEQPVPLLASAWQQVCDWWAPEDTEWHSGRHWSPAAAAATAVVSVTAAAAVAACVARRVHSS